MTEELNNTNAVENDVPATPPEAAAPDAPQSPPTPPDSMPEANGGDERMDDRLERLGGEPAPAITPEEFARLQKAGTVHIDSRGRIRTARPSEAEGGVSLRKRRAWYAGRVMETQEPV